MDSTLETLETLEIQETQETLEAEEIVAPAPPPPLFSNVDGTAPNLDAILRIPVEVQVVLGSATMPVAELIKLARGAVISLGQKVGEPVDVVVNGRVVARGEVVVVEGEPARFGIQLTEIVGPPRVDQFAG